MNALTTLRSNMWGALDGDATLTALLVGGTKIDWSPGARKRLLVQPAMCPVLLLGPQSADVPGLSSGPRRRTSGHDQMSEWSVSLSLEAYTAGQSVADAEEIVMRALTVLAAEFPFGETMMHAMDFPQFEFDVQPDAKGANPIWLAQLICTARYRTGSYPT